jgi:riboflavin transporter
MTKKLNPREIALCSALAAISAILQLMHFGFQSAQLGIWIDAVACSWIIAFFLFGCRGAMLTSFIGVIIITLFAPETWLGAVMKWTTTLPMWLSLFAFAAIKRQSRKKYSNFSSLVIPLGAGIILRCIIALPLNYYFAIPIWTGMTATKAISSVPWYIICGLNIFQGLLDVLLAWIITFKFKLIRFASWNEKT